MEFLYEIIKQIDETSNKVLQQAIKETDNGTYKEIKDRLSSYNEEIFGEQDMTKPKDISTITNSEQITAHIVNDAIAKLDKKAQEVKPFEELIEDTKEPTEPDHDLPKGKEEVEVPEDSLESDTDDVEDHSEYEKGEV